VSERWDERYRNGRMLPEKPPERIVLDAMDLLPSGTALDVACGTGRHARALAARGWRVTAVDSSLLAVARLDGADGIEVVRADLEASEYQIARSAYDLICDTCFLHRPLFPKMAGGVRPGGLFVGVFPLEGINPAYRMQPGELPGHFSGWDIVTFAERPSASGRLRAEIIARKPLTFRG
jgi:SAM-dependent methyltransferase